MSAVEAPEMQHVRLNEDAWFLIPSGDPYWPTDVRMQQYEPEIACVLERAADRPYAMLDGGANYGLWSILASSEPYGRHPAVAIEPSRVNFACLLQNAKANGGRFHTLCRALSDVSRQRATLYGKKHYGLSLRPDWHPADVDCSEDVETITLDEIADRFFPERQYPPFIKLDVEGSETAAIKGASRLVDEGALILYEDHGKETAHTVSRFMLSLPDIAVWRMSSDMRVARISAIEEVAAIKTEPNLGYNFFAYRQPSPWSSLFERWDR